MPITNTAKKSLKKSLQRRQINIKRKELLRTTEKQYRKLIAESNIPEAQKTLNILYKLLDKAAKNKLIKKNKAARDKSKLTKLLKKK
ncbi:MAG: 30S ribosomal protein S20 [Parcubacteria group bacterium]|nr:30S ribosomal protein S20 [Parcubacteria group bacterium]